MKTPIPGDPRELQCALNHPQRRIAVSIHDPITKRPVIGADPHRPFKTFALVYQWTKRFLNPSQFLSVLGIGVFVRGEFLRVSIIPRIDPNHLDPFHSLHCRSGLEMNIRNHWHIGTTLANTRNNLLEIGGITFGLGRNPNDLTPYFHQRHRLINASFSVQRVASEHGLTHHWVIAAHHHAAIFRITNHHGPGRTPVIAIR